ncbi:MAG: thiamine ABC transporter substrate-binding protein [Acidimicrobiia bacterium]|nr:thiamine ABC transporter substrate-binding protein [Acidimicrobiia bacterium]
MKIPRALVALMVLAVAASACSDSNEPAVDELTLMTHDSFALSEGILEQFTAETGITVNVLNAGDAGSMLSQAILTKDNPIADVIYGVDNTFLSRALNEGIFLEYESELLSEVFDELVIDPRVTPIDFGDVCVNYDRAAFDSVPPPVTLADLTDPIYRDMLVVQDPASSSPGLAFLLATISTFPESAAYTWRDYWADLKANGVLVTSGWTEAYTSEFSAGGGEGDRPIVVSYASSPAVGVYFTDPPPAEAPTASLLDGCFRQVEYAGIVAGAPDAAAAGMLIDHLLSVPVQEDIPLNMFVYPANSRAALPEVFTAFSPVPATPAAVAVDEIELNRETWINEWTDILR